MKGMLMRPELIPLVPKGIKTVTRRLSGLKEINEEPDKWTYFQASSPVGIFTFFYDNLHIYNRKTAIVTIKPRYHVNETVYIKEAWRLYGWDDEGGEFWLQYRDETISESLCVTEGVIEKYWLPNNLWPEDKWRTPMFMPAWAARYFIQITDVRAERLQEITDNDIRDEGTPSTGIVPVHTAMLMTGTNNLDELQHSLSRACFAELWDSINPDYPWKSNPWNIRYAFKSVERPVGI